jgi:flagellar L-ring protein precursor FlgH
MQKVAIAITCLIGVCATADSLFTQQVADNGTLVSLKKRKFQPGDLITVTVRESIQALTDSNTNTKKESEIESEANVSDNAFLVTPRSDGTDPNHPDGLGLLTEGKLPNWSIETNNELRTTGKTQRKNSLITTITCTVIKVYENGNIEIEGEKVVSVNREDSRIYLRGTVRSRDVSPTSVVDSSRLANATIELRGRGPLWNNQRRGLLTRLLDWVSPY